MFTTIRNAWKIPELRKKILYTLLLIVIFRLGSVIPVPFISPEAMNQIMNSGVGTLLEYLDTFTGGAFANATIFAMGIQPYITSSIIIQLLTVAIPALERMQKDEDGRKKLKGYTRLITIALGAIQATGLYFGIRSAISNPGFLAFLTIALSFTAGTAFLMWLGEQINDKGIGNGISMIIFAGIISRLPSTVISFIQGLIGGTVSIFVVLGIVIISLVIIAAVVFMTDSERKINVQYAKKVVGRKMYGGQNTHIPIKLMATGVMPIIFASSLLMFIPTVAQFFGKEANTTTLFGRFLGMFSTSSWFYIVAYFFLILFFTYFYTAIQYNPIEIANNIKKNGGFVPGLRPGRPTSDFIMKVLTRVTLAGAFFLGFIAVLPYLLSKGAALIGAALEVGIGGTSLLIVVGVALETTKQLESQMLMRHYKGFLE